MRSRFLLVLVALGGCTLAVVPPAPGPSATAPISPGADAPAGRAVAACRNQAGAQMLAVRGVDGAEEVRGSGGFPVGQNVFLAVSRGGADYTVRCSYTYATAEARIMTL